MSAHFVQNPRQQAFEFFKLLYGSAETGHKSVWTLPDGLTESFPVAQIEEAVNYALSRAENQNVYVALGLQEAPVGGRIRGSESGVNFVPALFADIDTLDGPHAATNLPANLEEVLQLIRVAGLPEPSLVIFTGGGVHVYWLFYSPPMVTTPEQRAAAKALSVAWQAKLRATFQAVGYQLDSTQDLNRAVRIPGTYNHKLPSDPKPVQIISQGPRISLEQARSLVSRELSKAVSLPGLPTQGGTVAQRLAEERRKLLEASLEPPDFESILLGCAFSRHADADAPTLSEREWYVIISIAARCKDADRLVHELSASHPGYTREATDKKMQHALEGARPPLCHRMSKEFASDYCERCPFFGSIKSPISLGYTKPYLVRIQSRYVYDLLTDRYLDAKTGKILSARAFAAVVRSKVGKNPVDNLLGSNTMPKVDRFDYVAGDTRLIILEDDESLSANIWRPDGILPKEGDPSTILAHFDYLIPDPVSREHVLDYLAHLLQRPFEKIKHLLIITGPEGTGKSTVGLIMLSLIGERNSLKIAGKELSSRFKDRLINRQFIVVEEADHGEKFEVVEDLKDWVTGEFFSVEGKGIPFHSGRTPRGIVLNSNHDAPLVISEGSRRFMVVATADQKETPEYYDRLYSALADESTLAAFAAWLLARDLSNFNPHAEPPMTAARARAQEASLTPVAQIIEEMLRSEDFCARSDLVRIEDVLLALSWSRWDAGRLSPNRIAQALRALGARRIKDGRDIRLTTGKARLWAIRNQDRWLKASDEEIRAAYTLPLRQNPLPGIMGHTLKVAKEGGGGA